MHFNGQFELCEVKKKQQKTELNFSFMYRQCIHLFKKWFLVCVGFSRKSVITFAVAIQDNILVCSSKMKWIDIFFCHLN